MWYTLSRTSSRTWFSADRMPLGGFFWALFVLALAGLFATAGWLLFLYIVQHVRLV